MRCEAMKAANQAREHQGYVQAYGDEAFDELSQTVEGLAETIIVEGI